VIAYLIFAVFVIASIAVEFVASRRSHKCVEDWAHVSGMKIHAIRRRWLFLGPWQWRTGRWSRVYVMSISDREGKERQAFAKVGGGFGGLIADDIQVR
jgi:hypothetical protein